MKILITFYFHICNYPIKIQSLNKGREVVFLTVQFLLQLTKNIKKYISFDKSLCSELTFGILGCTDYTLHH